MTLPTSGQINLGQIYNEYWGVYPPSISDEAKADDLYYRFQGRSNENKDLNYFHGWQAFPFSFFRMNTPDAGYFHDFMYNKSWSPASSYDLYDFDFFVEASLGGYNVTTIDISLYVKEEWGYNHSTTPTPYGSEVRVYTGSSTPVLFNTRDTRMTGTSGSQEYNFALSNLNPATWRIYITNRTPLFELMIQNVYSIVTVRLDAIWINGGLKKAGRINTNGRYIWSVQTLFDSNNTNSASCMSAYFEL